MSTEDVLNRAEEVVLVPIGELIPHPKNMNKHTEDQINRLVKLIEYQGMRNPIIVQKGTSLIVAGHGRLEALKKMGVKKVPVIYQEFEDEAQLYAYMVSDNAINSNQWGGGLDLAQINTEMLDLGPDFDIDMLGIKDFTVEPSEVDLPNLGDGSDPDIQQVTFTLSNEQKDILDDAMRKAKENEHWHDELNQSQNGNILASIMRHYVNC